MEGQLRKPGLWEWLPKRGPGEAAADFEVPFELESEDGDRLSATITKSGTVEIRALAPGKVDDLGSVVIKGFAPDEAQALKKSAWGRLWKWVKGIIAAVKGAITFSGGPHLGTCRPDADVVVTHVDGVPVFDGATVGIKCTQ